MHNITHILSIHDNARKLPCNSDKEYLCIVASDSPGQNLTQYFPACNDFIHTARLRGGGVLIHCLAGMSRSVTVAVIYVMCVTSLSWRDSLKAVRGARNVANPNVGFLKQLQDFESERLNEERRRLRAKFHNVTLEEDDEQMAKQLLASYYHSLSLGEMCDGNCPPGVACPRGLCHPPRRVGIFRRNSRDSTGSRSSSPSRLRSSSPTRGPNSPGSSPVSPRRSSPTPPSPLIRRPSHNRSSSPQLTPPQSMSPSANRRDSSPQGSPRHDSAPTSPNRSVSPVRSKSSSPLNSPVNGSPLSSPKHTFTPVFGTRHSYTSPPGSPVSPKRSSSPVASRRRSPSPTPKRVSSAPNSPQHSNSSSFYSPKNIFKKCALWGSSSKNNSQSNKSPKQETKSPTIDNDTDSEKNKKYGKKSNQTSNEKHSSMQITKQCSLPIQSTERLSPIQSICRQSSLPQQHTQLTPQYQPSHLHVYRQSSLPEEEPDESLHIYVSPFSSPQNQRYRYVTCHFTNNGQKPQSSDLPPCPYDELFKQASMQESRYKPKPSPQNNENESTSNVDNMNISNTSNNKSNRVLSRQSSLDQEIIGTKGPAKSLQRQASLPEKSLYSNSNSPQRRPPPPPIPENARSRSDKPSLSRQNSFQLKNSNNNDVAPLVLHVPVLNRVPPPLPPNKPQYVPNSSSSIKNKLEGIHDNSSKKTEHSLFTESPVKTHQKTESKPVLELELQIRTDKRPESQMKQNNPHESPVKRQAKAGSVEKPLPPLLKRDSFTRSSATDSHVKRDKKSDSKTESNSPLESPIKNKPRSDSFSSKVEKRPESSFKSEERPESPLKYEKRPESPLKSEKRPELPLKYEKRPESPLKSEKRPELPLRFEKRPDSLMKSEKRPDSLTKSEKRPDSLMKSDKRPDSLLKSEKRPESPLKSEKRSDSPLKSEKRPESPFKSEKRPDSPFKSEKRPESPLKSERRPDSPFKSEKRPDSPFKSEKRPESPLKSERRPDSPLKSEKRPDSPFKSEKRPELPLKSEKRPQSPLKSEKRPQSPLTSERRSESPLIQNTPPGSPVKKLIRSDSPINQGKRPESPLKQSNPVGFSTRNQNKSDTSCKTDRKTETVIVAKSKPELLTRKLQESNTLAKVEPKGDMHTSSEMKFAKSKDSAKHGVCSEPQTKTQTLQTTNQCKQLASSVPPSNKASEFPSPSKKPPCPPRKHIPPVNKDSSSTSKIVCQTVSQDPKQLKGNESSSFQQTSKAQQGSSVCKQASNAIITSNKKETQPPVPARNRQPQPTVVKQGQLSYSHVPSPTVQQEAHKHSKQLLHKQSEEDLLIKTKANTLQEQHDRKEKFQQQSSKNPSPQLNDSLPKSATPQSVLKESSHLEQPSVIETQVTISSAVPVQGNSQKSLQKELSATLQHPSPILRQPRPVPPLPSSPKPSVVITAQMQPRACTPCLPIQSCPNSSTTLQGISSTKTLLAETVSSYPSNNVPPTTANGQLGQLSKHCPLSQSPAGVPVTPLVKANTSVESGHCRKSSITPKSTSTFVHHDMLPDKIGSEPDTGNGDPTAIYQEPDVGSPNLAIENVIVPRTDAPLTPHKPKIPQTKATEIINNGSSDMLRTSQTRNVPKTNHSSPPPLPPKPSVKNPQNPNAILSSKMLLTQ